MSWLDQYAMSGSPGGRNNTPGGATAGQATGTIRINTAQLSKGRAIVQTEARAMGRALQTIGPSTQSGVRQANSALNSLKQQVGAVTQVLNIALGTITAIGVRSANHMRAINGLFLTLAGSQEQANKYMAQLEEVAERTNRPMTTLLESANGLLPALRNTNASLGQTLMLAQRLAILDPAQGMAGAAYAIREFLNEEYISLSRRFEMSRTRLRQIIEESGGDQAKAIQGLSDYVSELGLTEEAQEAMGKSGRFAWANLRGEVKMTLAEAFEPTAIVLNEIAQGFANILKQVRRVDPQLLKVAGTLATIATISTAPQALARLPLIRGVLTAGDASSTDGTSPAGGGRLGRSVRTAGVLAAAGYVGTQAGVGLARLGGRAGNKELARFSDKSQQEASNMIKTTLKQVLVIMFNALMQLVKAIQEGAFRLVNLWDIIKAGMQRGWAKVRNVLADAVDALGQIFGLLVLLLAEVWRNLRNAFASLVDAVGNAAAGLLRMVASLLDKINTIDLGFMGEVNLGLGGTIDNMNEFADAADAMGESMRQNELDQGLIDTATSWGKAGDSIRVSDEQMRKWADTIGQGTALTREQARALENTARLGDEWTESLARTLGVIKEYNSVLDITGNLVEAIAQKQLEAIDDPQDVVYSDEVLAAWMDFQDDLEEAQREMHDDLAEEERQYNEARTKAIGNHNAELADMEVKFNRERAEAASEYQHDVAEQEEEYQRERSEEYQKATQKQKEIIADREETLSDLNEEYHADVERAERDHKERLEDIQRNGKEQIIRAAMRLDAQGVWQAQRNMEQGLREENDNYKDKQRDREDKFKKEREEAQENAEELLNDLWESYREQERADREHHQRKLADLAQSYHEQEQKDREHYQRQRQEKVVAHQQELTELRTAHARRLSEIRTQADAEIEALRAEFLETFIAMQKDAGVHQANLINIHRVGQATAEAELSAWWERQKRMFSGGGTTHMPATQYRQTFNTPTLSSYGGYRAPRFARGGAMPFTGMAHLEAGEHVLTPNTSGLLRRMLGGAITEPALLSAVGGGREGRANVIESLNMTNYYPQTEAPVSQYEIERMVNRAVRNALGATT